VERRVLSQQNLELPRINPSRTGRPYRIVWGTANRVPGHFTDTLVRVDVTTGEARCWHQEACFPGEPVFVPRPRGASRADPTPEDDGVLLSVVLDAANATSFLLVLDAATLEEVARATVPHALPLGFHGEFCGAE
jgi:carotenoid cleavage dioxygenase-like enzyme